MEVVASMLPWQPVVDGDVIPAPSDRSHRCRGRRGHRPPGRHEHRRASTVPGARRRDRPGHRRGPGRSRGGLRAPGRSDAGRLSRGTSGRQRRRPARGHPDRLVLAHPRHPPGRRPREERRGHLHVRVCLALTAVRRTPRRVPCARDPLRLRHARQRDRAALGTRTRRNSSPTPCTPPGWRLPPRETAVGRSTISAAGRPCASIPRRRSWTILDPRSGRCGKACVSCCTVGIVQRRLREAERCRSPIPS